VKTKILNRLNIRLLPRWLGLCLLGWLLYAVIRTTLGLIYLGIPWFDWQWYGALIALLGLLTLFLAGFRLGRPRGAGLFTLLTLWLVLGFGGFGQSLTLRPNQAPPVPISFWAGAELGSAAPAELLTDIHAAGGQLYLNVSEDSFDGARRQTLIRQLSRLNTFGIGAYLVVNASNYISVPVSAEWVSGVRKAAAFVQAEKLTNIRGLIGDAEPPYKLPLDYLGLDTQGFNTTVQSYAELLTFMSQTHPGLQLGFTAGWPQYVDTLDGDSDLSLILRSPVDPPQSWTYVNMMTYSSYLPDPAWRPYFMYLVEHELPRQYAQHPLSYLIGIVGYPPEPLLTFDELVRDAQISRAMRADEVVIFRLEGSLKEFGPDFVRRLTAQVNGPAAPESLTVPFSRPVSILLFLQLFFDSLLDLRHWPGLLLLGWGALSAFLIRRSRP